MASLQELIAQKEALELEIERTRHKDRADTIGKIRTLMDQYGLTAADLSAKSGAKKTTAAQGNKVAAKYRDAATGETWSGRGLTPRWLSTLIAQGQSKESFAIAS